MLESRGSKIQRLAGDGKLKKLRSFFESEYTQLEIDVALESAIAYSQIETAEYLQSLGADFSNYNYQGVYYAVHNDELEGLKYSISKGVDINVNKGMILNTGVETSINSKNIDLVKWILDNGANPDLLTKDSLSLVDSYGTDELKELIKGVGYLFVLRKPPSMMVAMFNRLCQFMK